MYYGFVSAVQGEASEAEAPLVNLNIYSYMLAALIMGRGPFSSPVQFPGAFVSFVSHLLHCAGLKLKEGQVLSMQKRMMLLPLAV